MNNSSARSRFLRLSVLGLLSPATTALAQGPVITGIVPLANARAAAQSGPVTVSFNQNLTAGSASALKVFSSQRGGLRTRGTTQATVSGNSCSFVPTAYPFMPGETVNYTVTTAAASSGGTLARARVGQFTTAVSGTGTGNFLLGATTIVGNQPLCTAFGDVDGDGDLDIAVANRNGSSLNTISTISIRLNNGSGAFSGSQTVNVGYEPNSVVVGDVDGDGDLDLIAANNRSNTVSIRLNNGNGIFSGTQDVPVGNGPMRVVLGDVDGDGDSDFLIANYAGRAGTTVSIRLNNGNGIFSGTQDVLVGSGPISVAVGDVDNDGDLDFVCANQASNSVSLRLNDGNGLFSGTANVAVGATPSGVAVGDVDGDGDLDLLSCNASGTVSVRLNNGSGLFSGGSDPAIAGGALGLAVGDIDADGDLDVLATSYSNPGLTSVLFNNSSGIFGSFQTVTVGVHPVDVALGDIDGDGDLDFITSDFGFSAGTPSTVSICYNQRGLATTGKRLAYAYSIYPNPVFVHGTATVTNAPPRATITLLDALGRTVFTATTDAEGAASIALPAGLSPGLYLVRCGAQVRRLQVE